MTYTLKEDSMKTAFDAYEYQFGKIYVVMDESGIIKRVILTPGQWDDYVAGHGQIDRDPALCRNAIQQLDEYFTGKRSVFTVPLSICTPHSFRPGVSSDAEDGTEFHKKVWKALLDIPFGEIRSYADIALAVGSPRGFRAVGQANRRNPIPIFVPCHRVIGKNGALTGFCGVSHLEIKEYLLNMERKYKQKLVG
jgi:methylated-DNA-[protein]-cysteine S-methyltransferase